MICRITGLTSQGTLANIGLGLISLQTVLPSWQAVDIF